MNMNWVASRDLFHVPRFHADICIMNKDDCFLLGKITKPFSFKGEVVLWMDVDDPEPYEAVETLWIPQHNMLVPYAVESLRASKDRYVVRLADVTTEDQAKSLAGKDVWLPASVMAPIEEGRFYFHEVQGWKVVDLASHEDIATIVHVVDQGAYPMLEVTLVGGQQGFIPLPDHVEVQVLREARTLVVELPEGLLDVYLGHEGSDEDEDDGDDESHEDDTAFDMA
jgi:16S rRNA processing protein RimM